MAGLVPGIHVLGAERKAWMAGTGPAMTPRKQSAPHPEVMCQHGPAKAGPHGIPSQVPTPVRLH
jgi:hypothetical protein